MGQKAADLDNRSALPTYRLNAPSTFTDPLGLASSNYVGTCSDPEYYYSQAECGARHPTRCHRSVSPASAAPMALIPPFGSAALVATGSASGDSGGTPAAGGAGRTQGGTSGSTPTQTQPVYNSGVVIKVTAVGTLEVAGEGLLALICGGSGVCEGVVAGALVGAAVGYGAAKLVDYIHQAKGGKEHIVPSWAEGERPLPGESATGSDFSDKKQGRKRCRRHGSKEGQLWSLGFSREASMAASAARGSALHCKPD